MLFQFRLLAYNTPNSNTYIYICLRTFVTFCIYFLFTEKYIQKGICYISHHTVDFKLEQYEQ